MAPRNPNRVSNTIIKGTDLRWERVRPEGSTKRVDHSLLRTERGTYKMKEIRDNKYRLSYTPREGEEFDLGEYRLRAECDSRVISHLAE